VGVTATTTASSRANSPEFVLSLLRYRAFGLEIDSQIALASGTQTVAVLPADVAIKQVRQLGPVGVEPSGSSVQIRWEGVCDVRAREGATLELCPVGGADASDVSLAAAGAGLALILEQRGMTVLHGSCLAVGGRGVCVVGDSGAGKSTLAAALCGRGHRFISDGMTAVDLSGAVALALPGWQNVKLLPDAAAALGLHSSTAPLVHRDSQKRLFALAAPEVAPVQLHYILALSGGEALACQRLGGSEAAIEVMRNYFLIAELHARHKASILQRCALIAARVRCCRLRRTSSLQELSDLVALVENAVAEP
jgi:HPr Serine kinase C-terminal domain